VNRLKVFATIVLKVKSSGNLRKDGLVDTIISEAIKGLPTLNEEAEKSI